MGNLYMSMMLVRIRERNLVVSSAGMPPILIYRKSSAKLEEVIIKSPPLGGFENLTYQQRRTVLEGGDTILLMTDGFVELFNEDNEMMVPYCVGDKATAPGCSVVP